MPDKSAELAHLDQLFDAALSLPGTQRQAFLAGLEAREPTIAAELRVLLQHSAASQATDAFRASVVDAWSALDAAAPDRDLAPGERIGPYAIVRLLGRGGMAPVYLAKRADGIYSQQVALKLIPCEVARAEAVGRFARERQILALLSHPNIARLLDGGLDPAGRSYIAMEYVDGEPIDQYCDAHRLSLESRIEVLIKVADAVQHAHRNLVIHRDLKPSNILVGPDAAVKLLDFGIATLLDDGQRVEQGSHRTSAMFRALTPAYASPEQLRGDLVTTASDVYQLGLLLYELLTGVRANDGAGRNGVPTRPSAALDTMDAGTLASVAGRRGMTGKKLQRTLRGDLDNIVLKALETDPRSRYDSPASLARDLQCHAAGLPVSARNATRRYRLGKFVRRHTMAVAAAALAACVLVAFLLTISLQAVKLRIERDRVRLEAAKAGEIRDFLTSLFDVPLEVANPTLSATDLIDAAAARVDRIDARQPLVRAQMMHTLGGLYIRLGAYDRARQLIENALALRRERLGDAHLETAETLLLLGMVRNHLDDHTGAEPLVREAVAIGERVLGPNHWGVAFALTELGTSLRRQGRYGEAEQILSRAATIYRAYPDKAMGAPTNALGLIRAQLGDFDGAERYYREAIAINVARFGAEHPLVQTNRTNLAVALLGRGRAREAEAMLRGVVAARRHVLGNQHPDLGVALVSLADAVRVGGDAAGAEALVLEALTIFEQRYPGGHSRIAEANNTLVRVRADLTAQRRH